MTHTEDFLQALFALAEDADKEVVKHVCSAFVLLVEVRVDVLMPHMANIIEVNFLSNLIKFSVYALTNPRWRRSYRTRSL